METHRTSARRSKVTRLNDVSPNEPKKKRWEEIGGFQINGSGNISLSPLFSVFVFLQSADGDKTNPPFHEP